MSNQNINISVKNTVGKCDLKCSYAFKYSESNSTAKNNGIMINLTYDSRSIPPVSYNNQQYRVSTIMIVSPSIHIFNGASMPGEMIIEHTPVKGGNNLSVCIPFISSTESSTSSTIITEIIKKVATNAPSKGDSTNLNIPSFNLQNIIPRKPFFAYSEGVTDWIVFGNLDAIPLSSNILTTLQKIIKPWPIQLKGGDLFYNSKGPSSGVEIGDGIYISCQPTGSSKDEVPIMYDKPSVSIDFSNIFESPIFRTIIIILIACILFILIFYGINAFYGYLVIDTPKLLNLNS